MKFITGQDRNQIPLFASSIEAAIDQDNEVRLIDMFVDSIKLADFGFKFEFMENGRPAYHPSVLLKLYIYGYMNRIRSSRALEKECGRNIELMWLMKSLVPDHNTISNFRRDNPKAIRKVFRATVQLAKHFDLIGGKLLAGDSTKLRAQNSKKNNFNEAKIERHIAYIDARLEEYSKILAAEDKEAVSEPEKVEIQQKIKKHKERKAGYQHLRQQLELSGETQISTSDPESRQMITRNNITEVVLSVQTTVDEKHNIPIDYKVTNQTDNKAMGGMVRRAKTILQDSSFTLLYDKGYHTGGEFDYAQKQGVEVIVAIPGPGSHAPDQAFDIEHFVYDKQTDSFTCPAAQTLTSNGNQYDKSSSKSNYKVKQYKTNECQRCPFATKCTKSKNGRILERSEYADLIDANKNRYLINKEVYRRRQAIVEHPYGTIKRQWGFSYIMTKKTMKRASADVGLIFVVYNLRRIMNIVGHEKLKEYLKALIFVFCSIIAYFKAITRSNFFWVRKLLLRNALLISNLLLNFNPVFSPEINFGRGY
ncbi:MAG: IS1182 family transposase [Bacteroidales bacterium]|nr:IS1182 family transposase [Bacteroidales bacterium]